MRVKAKQIEKPFIQPKRNRKKIKIIEDYQKSIKIKSTYKIEKKRYKHKNI